MANSDNYRQLDPAKIISTIDRLSVRIGARFQDSGLSSVCGQLLDISRQAKERAKWISRPIWILRIGTGSLVCIFALVVAWSLLRFPLRAEIADLPELVQTLEAGTSELLVIGAGIFFLVTLERRIKRRRALSAIHELRSIAHIIDMHQLTKDPERLLKRWNVTEVSPKATMNAFELSRYLDYCSEMLSLTGKVAALYVQRFDDEVALVAVNEVEALTTGLSRKIWQKIMIINSFEEGASLRAIE